MTEENAEQLPNILKPDDDEAPPPAPEEPAQEGEQAEEQAAANPQEVAAETTEAAKPENARVARRLEVAARAEMRARQKEIELAKKHEELAAKEAEVAELLKKYEPLKSGDIIEGMKAVGINPREALERMASEPEVQNPVLSEVQKLEARLEAMAKKAEEAEAKARAIEEQRANEMRAQRVSAAKNDFVNFIADNASQYPSISTELMPDEIISLASEEIRAYETWHKAEYPGVPVPVPTDEAVAKVIETRAKEIADKRREWRERVNGAKQQPGSGNVSSDAGAGAQVSKRPNTPRTLTNGDASQRASAPAELTAEQEREQLLKMLEGAISL